VPASAVIYAGARRVVFVDRGEGRLEPRAVETGVTTDDAIEILSGLEPGERVVAAGNFLIAAESRLQSALEQW
jgi:Cu(I)/Ag(I) efflux system membrane fusion protein